MNEVCRRIGKHLILFFKWMTHCGTQWMAVWLHKTMCSSFSFICNRPENPEHSWGYQTVLLCYLLCRRFESRLGAQVSTQELCKTQCDFGFIHPERTWICRRDEAQVSPPLSWVLVSYEFVSVNYIHRKSVSESGVVVPGPPVSLMKDSPMPQDASRMELLPTSPVGAASFPLSVLWSDANTTQETVRPQKRPAPRVQRYLPWRSACLEATILWNWDNQAYPFNAWLHF